MTSRLTFLGVLFLLLSCMKTEKKYPQIVIDKHLEEQFDAAKFEAYKFIGGVECNCEGVFHHETQETNRDTFKLLSLDLALDHLNISGDTVFYSLDFYARDKTGQLRETTSLSKFYGDCFDSIAIGFIKKAKSPFLAYIDDQGIFYYKDTVSTHTRDSIFYECVKSGVKINPWLQDYLAENLK